MQLFLTLKCTKD